MENQEMENQEMEMENLRQFTPNPLQFNIRTKALVAQNAWCMWRLL
jgi:hypothetical protein